MAESHRQRRRQSRRGNALIEFALVSVFLAPLLLSTVSLGLNLSRTIQVTQVVRDAASMYSRFVDFSLSGNKDMLVRLATGLGMTASGGNGVVILSKVTYIASNDCTAAGYNSSTCTNMNQYVVMNRVVVGNTSFHASAFGTPGGSSLDTNGDALLPFTDTSLRATGFSNVVTLSSGEYAFVSEGFFTGISWTVSGQNVGNQIASRAIF